MNHVPGYFCICKDGFNGDGVVCSDVKECETSPCGDHEAEFKMIFISLLDN